MYGKLETVRVQILNKSNRIIWTNICVEGKIEDSLSSLIFTRRTVYKRIATDERGDIYQNLKYYVQDHKK